MKARQPSSARATALGVLIGVVGGALEVAAVWLFLGLDAQTRTVAAVAVGFFGLAAGIAIVFFWSVTSFPTDLKRRGVMAGVSSICGGTLALLWAANAEQALQLTAAAGAIVAGLVTRQLGRRHFKQRVNG